MCVLISVPLIQPDQQGVAHVLSSTRFPPPFFVYGPDTYLESGRASLARLGRASRLPGRGVCCFLPLCNTSSTLHQDQKSQPTLDAEDAHAHRIVLIGRARAGRVLDPLFGFVVVHGKLKTRRSFANKACGAGHTLPSQLGPSVNLSYASSCGPLLDALVRGVPRYGCFRIRRLGLAWYFDQID